MANPLTTTLAKIFRDRAKTTSLRRLRREGHRSVRVLDVAHLDQMVRTSLELVLTESSGDPVEAHRIARSAQIDFVRLLGEKDTLERTAERLRREQAALEDNVGEVRGALEDARDKLHCALESHGKRHFELVRNALTESWESPFERTLQRWEHEDNVRTALAELREPLFDATVSVLSRTDLGPTSESAESAQVEILERRIRKLHGSLDEAREMMERLRDKRDTEDEGVASVYTEVQGLNGNEANFDQRKHLLRRVFQLNLDLKNDLSKEASDEP